MNPSFDDRIKDLVETQAPPISLDEVTGSAPVNGVPDARQPRTRRFLLAAAVLVLAVGGGALVWQLQPANPTVSVQGPTESPAAPIDLDSVRPDLPAREVPFEEFLAPGEFSAPTDPVGERMSDLFIENQKWLISTMTQADAHRELGWLKMVTEAQGDSFRMSFLAPIYPNEREVLTVPGVGARWIHVGAGDETETYEPVPGTQKVYRSSTGTDVVGGYGSDSFYPVDGAGPVRLDSAGGTPPLKSQYDVVAQLNRCFDEAGIQANVTLDLDGAQSGYSADGVIPANQGEVDACDRLVRTGSSEPAPVVPSELEAKASRAAQEAYVSCMASRGIEVTTEDNPESTFSGVGFDIQVSDAEKAKPQYRSAIEECGLAADKASNAVLGES